MTMFKPEIRIIAWDDYAFKFKDKKVGLVGAIFRGGKFMDGLLSTEITKDGTDVTDKIAKSILSSRHYDQLSIIILDSISFGGLNIVDIKLLNRITRLPVIVVTRKEPDIESFLSVMKKLKNYSFRQKSVKNAGPVYSYKDIFYQMAGLTAGECEEIFKITCTQSNIPEPLRVAHIIASGLSRQLKDVRSTPDESFSGFESKGRA